MATSLFGENIELARKVHGLTQVLGTVLRDIQEAVLSAVDTVDEEERSDNEFGA